MTTTAEHPFVIGITGNIACGKSFALDAVAALGADAIDADRVYHGLIAPGMPLLAELAACFGPGVIDAQGGLDRRALGAIVFSDPAALADLDRISHPAVIAEVQRRIASSNSAVVAVDAVKLVQSGLADACDRVWLVTCEPDQQIARLKTRNGIDDDDARRRIAAQPPLDAALARADLVIDNSGTPDETRRQIAAAWRALPILHS